MTLELHGIGVSRGVAIGKVHMLSRDQPEVNEYILPSNLIESEVQRYQAALITAKAQLQSIQEQIPDNISTDIAAFINTHLLMLEDKALVSVPVELIQTRHCNAEWALKLQRDALVSVFDEMDDSYLRTRKNDVDHVVNRILRTLTNQESPYHEALGSRLKGYILLADDLTPADIVLMQQQQVGGFATEHGGANSHTSILARSLGIPAIVGLRGARRYVQDDELLIIDGGQGILLAGVDDPLIKKFQERRADQQRRLAALAAFRGRPAVTLEGQLITLEANIELPEDLPLVTDSGAEGIGLYRTEFLYMNRTAPPDEEEQLKAYTRVVEALGGAPVTIRTVDLGADKTVDGSYSNASVATNPALGLRAIRLCLRKPGLFRPQLRAILRASARGPVRLLLPMICTLQELTQVMALLEDCKRELKRQGLKYDPALPVGAMIEVPATAICAEVFARHLDFLSIGTNDLTQYTLAIDRIDDEVNYLYSPLHPAVLHLIHRTIAAGEKTGTAVAMCGEMAGDIHYTRLLLALGLRDFSMHPASLLEVKQVITESDQRKLTGLAQQILECCDLSEMQALLEQINEGLPH
ncbi:phosphoenolpyruvate--protein phosphotransferase [Nitrosococcus oceani]|uniref:Phosphoenolpyruvate-protein phosphotransferase n=2 Tax=Nitrosococcus oceani TaxID=1229 RepID=Q3J7E9_NITOC|nr:phosphoenolpyruvate--protein phosphotransferase [Nitrosococcus oceani]KFI18275.1 phosphoenolpyruvate-protein phosphotransferase [Nitrosococcus oceani C-27]ABA59247.1 phosphoenolpyruvate--protein phosphotransferase [Nitrosococcus oceani ATCC 19707]EDZ65857.1 phosphoenolpyruvate-protein phosphotransferase [Nitrosococcus oceani AFC27]KFI21453.1 phosphoenolpyruvate-protein phosphotransferase [Nitrosococcus oceani]GEM21072.1 phosphoenolpyruvate--protein phosphotransferase [Nitrosococcus oceani]